MRGGQKGVLLHTKRKVSGKKNTETVRSGEKRRRKRSRRRRVLFSLIRKLSPRKICPELSDQESLGVGLQLRKRVTGYFTDQRRR